MNIPQSLVIQIDNVVNSLKGWKWDFGNNNEDIIEKFKDQLFELGALISKVEDHEYELQCRLPIDELNEKRLRKQD